MFEGDPALDVDPERNSGMYPFELAFDIVDGRPAIDDGVLIVPDRPGLGVDVNLDVVEDYPFVGGPWTEFEYDEKPVQTRSVSRAPRGQ